LKVLFRSLPRAAAAALLLCACAGEDPALHKELTSLRTEVQTLQRENAEMSRKLDALGSRVDLLAARPVAPAAPPAPVAAEAPPPSTSAAEPLVPARLKVVRLVPEAEKASLPKARARATPVSPRGAASPVPTSTPLHEPDPGTLVALGAGGKDLAAEAQAALDAAWQQAGLSRARALEQFNAHYPGHRGAQDSLVGAARARAEAGDPDGSCEDYAKAVREYPAGSAMPDALAGLASCEARAGRTDEAKRLMARLAQDYPSSPALKRASERAPAAQGAAP